MKKINLRREILIFQSEFQGKIELQRTQKCKIILSKTSAMWKCRGSDDLKVNEERTKLIASEQGELVRDARSAGWLFKSYNL